MVDLGLICCFSGFFIVRNKENPLEIKTTTFEADYKTLVDRDAIGRMLIFFYINKVGRKQVPRITGYTHGNSLE